MTGSIWTKTRTAFRSSPRRGAHAGGPTLRRLSLGLIASAGVCLLVALSAIAWGAAKSSADAVRPTSMSSPLSARKISLRELGGRIVGTAVIMNTGSTPVRATTGALGLSQGSGAKATGVLIFSAPSLPSGASRRVRFTTRPISALPVRSGTYRLLICTDIYSQIQRFAQDENCSGDVKLAVAKRGLPRLSRRAPNTVITTGVTAASSSSTAFFRFVSTVGHSTFECSLDGGPWLACRSPESYRALVDGAHAFAVRAIGPSGNPDPTPSHVRWTVDTVPPVVALNSPVSGTRTTDTTPTFSGAAAAAAGDLPTITVKVFSGSSTAGSPVRTLTTTASGGSWSVAPSQALPAGTYTAEAVQFDSAGNTSVSAASTFTIVGTAGAGASGSGGQTTGPSPSTPGPVPPSSYSIGGTVSGLTGAVVLQDNGGDNLSITSNGAFTFHTSVTSGGAYDVTVASNPSGQSCTTAGGAGTVASANVTSVSVKCVTAATDEFDRANGGLGPAWAPISDGPLSISSQQVVGTAGANAGETRVAESYGSDQYSRIQVTSTPLPSGDWVGPSVRSQNSGQDTYLGLYWNDQFTGNYELLLYVRHSGNWTQLGSTYTLSGPLPAGTQLTLSAVGSRISFQENGVELIATTDSSLAGGAPGIVTYGAATAGAWAGGDASSYSVGGTVSGLSGTVVLQDNGGDDLSVSSDGQFTFGTPIVQEAAYNVAVVSNPSGQTCTVSSGTGTVASADVTGVTVACSSSSLPQMQVQYVSTDANGVATYDVTSADDGYGTQILRVLKPSSPAAGVPHNFLYVLPVEPNNGTYYGDGLETLRSVDAQDKYNLTIIEPSFGTDPWYADNPKDPNVQYESFMTNDLVPWVTKNLTETGREQNWLIGFSKSAQGAQDLLLRHPNVFSLAASWDFPADMASYSAFGTSSEIAYGTDTNFQANYRLTTNFVDAHKAAFLSENRIWIGGYNDFQTDMADYDSLLTSEGIEHTTESPQLMAHRWDSGWVPAALTALSQDSAALPATP